MTIKVSSPVWVIVTGTIRDEDFLLQRFHFLAELKATGCIQQVVFSTWMGEVENFANVAKVLQQFDFILVESNEPNLVCRGHYLHQAVSLKNALDVCPSNSFVFRTRTDKCGEESGIIDSQIKTFLSEKKYIRACDDDLGVLNYKIGTMGYHTTVSNSAPVLFFWHDRAYFGLKEDLQKFINYNVLAFEFQKLIPEQALFSFPFLQWWPGFSCFFDAVNQSDAVEKIFFNNAHTPEKTDRLTTFLVSNRLFRQAVIAEKYVLKNCFFDIQTGLDFDFNAKYREIDLCEIENPNDFLSTLSSRTVKAIDYSDDMQSISKFLEVEFSIPPVRRMSRSASTPVRNVYVTPQSGITIKSPLIA